MHKAQRTLKDEDIIIAFDVEGPLINPGFDFAWIVENRLLAEGFLDEGKYEERKKFDEYDDERWRIERSEKGWCTGTTPLISQSDAAYYGLDNKQLLRLASTTMMENEGVDLLMKYLREMNCNGVLVTSSYAAIPLLIGAKYEILSSHIFSSGYQVSRDELAYYDEYRNIIRELDERSPLTRLSEYTNELGEFLGRYISHCNKILDCYTKGDEATAKSLIASESNLFDGIENKKLQKELIYLFAKQNGVMGAHNKVRAISSLGVPADRIIYFGDSIVDADPLMWAGCGVALNCTNKEALLSCKINICAFEMGGGILNVIDDIIKGIYTNTKAHNINEIVSKYSSQEFKIFSKNYIRNNLMEVLKINGEFKSELKISYKKVINS